MSAHGLLPSARRLKKCPCSITLSWGISVQVFPVGRSRGFFWLDRFIGGASILVLDEATSHLDIANESAVNDAIKHLELTRIIIAHRPETIASAGRVVKLVNGALWLSPAPATVSASA